jgi:hypothetical protein
MKVFDWKHYRYYHPLSYWNSPYLLRQNPPVLLKQFQPFLHLDYSCPYFVWNH